MTEIMGFSLFSCPNNPNNNNDHCVLPTDSHEILPDYPTISYQHSYFSFLSNCFLSFSLASSTFILDMINVITNDNTIGIHKYITCNMFRHLHQVTIRKEQLRFLHRSLFRKKYRNTLFRQCVYVL